MLAGLRWDRFKVDLDDKRTTTTRQDLSRTDTEVSPRFGLTWTPTPAQTYYASYSYAFLPSGEQLSLAANTQDLAPEKSINHEIGARWDLNPDLTLSAALFRLTRVDGAVYYSFPGGKTRVALNVENLSDKEYFPTAHSDNNISPGAPLNARLTLSTAF